MAGAGLLVEDEASVGELGRRFLRRDRHLVVWVRSGGGGRRALDRDSHDVTVAGRPVDLTAKEFDLLAFFMANVGVVVSRDLLLDRVWGQEYPGGTRTVDVHIAQLRRKLGRPNLIRTLRGAGYKAIA